MSSTSDPDRLDPYREEPGAQPGSTAVLDRETKEREETADPGDHDRFAHYVRRDKITQATLDGTPVIALCGKVWVPGRDPGKYPVCPECKEIYEGRASRRTATAMVARAAPAGEVAGDSAGCSAAVAEPGDPAGSIDSPGGDADRVFLTPSASRPTPDRRSPAVAWSAL